MYALNGFYLTQFFYILGWKASTFFTTFENAIAYIII